MASRTFICGAYIRLSKEDGDKAESDSVANQKKLIQDYIRREEDLILHDLYIDDGFSGTDFDRPGFKRMIADIEQGKLDCIIVKDLSRFGRDYIDTGKYLERYLPERGVRFIAITDNIDSLKQAYDMLLPIKNIFNEQYARDISRKVNTAMRTKQKAGEFIGAFAKYGYKKSPEDKNRLIVDGYAADVVRRIFTMYTNGVGQRKIASVLNSEGILCPSEYKRQNGQDYRNPNRLAGTVYWTYSTVHRIIQDEMYIGNMVQGKTHQSLRGKPKSVAKEDWIRVEGTHPAIIDPGTWDRAQKLLAMNVREIDLRSDMSIFAGVLRCGDCGRAMVKKWSTWGRTRYRYFNCGTFNRSGAGYCTPHTVRQDILEQIVLADLHKLLMSIDDMDGLLMDIAIPKDRTLDAEIRRTDEALDRSARRKRAAYEDYQDGLLTKEEYIAYRDGLTAQEARLRQKRGTLCARKDLEAAKEDIARHPWVATLSGLRRVDALDRSIVLEMIAGIKVYEGKKIRIVYNLSDEAAGLLDS